MAHYVMITTVTMMCLAVIFSMAHAAAPGALSLADIVDGLKMRSHELQTLKANVRIACYKLDDESQLPNIGTHPAILRTAYGIRAKGDKLRVDHTYLAGDAPNSPVARTNILLWDGTKTYGYMSDWNKHSQLQTGGLIDGKRGSSFRAAQFLSAIERDTLEMPGPIERHIDLGTWNIIGNERVGSYDAIHCAGPVLSDQDAFLDVWVSPEHAFSPVRLKMTQRIHKGEIVLETRDVMLNKRMGVWVRTACKTTVRNPGVGPNLWVYTYDIGDIVLHSDISDDEFTITFPTGMTVFDKTTTLTYRVHEDGRMVPILYRAGQLGAVDLPGSDRHELPPLDDYGQSTAEGLMESRGHRDLSADTPADSATAAVDTVARYRWRWWCLGVGVACATIAVCSVLFMRRKAAWRKTHAP